MRLSPRTNGLALAVALACGFTPYARQRDAATRPAPQSPPASETKQPPKNTTAAKARAAKAEAHRLRRKAVAVLLEVAGDARALESPYDRAAVLAYCADALWETDEQSARALFRRAWEAAAESDEAELKEEVRYADLPERFTRARDLALTLTARRDARMAETFLRALTDWLGRRESSARAAPEEIKGNASRDIGPLNEFTEGGQRLGLAYSLLDEDSHKSAAAVAGPALAGGVSGALVEFLLRLRQYDEAQADRLFLRLLERTRADARADANDVLLLSSYALTPRLLAVVDRQGSVQFRALAAPGANASPDTTPARAAPARAAFFDAAASVLLRPARQAATTGEASALYFAIARLLPFFEGEATRHAPALHARLSSLAAEIEVGRRASLDSQTRTRRLTAENPDDPLRPLLEQVETTGGAKGRDGVRFMALRDAARRKLWDRARRLVGELEGEEYRDVARFMLAARQVASLSEAYAEGDADDFEKAAAFTRGAELSPTLSPTMRAYGLAQAAQLAARRGKRARAGALLDEAIAYAQQADGGTALRDAAALAVAVAAARSDSPRVWEALAAAVAALNEDEEFSGNAVQFGVEPGVKYLPEEREALVEAFAPFTLDELFAEAAAKDFDRTVAEARALRDKVARAEALLAAAQSALEESARILKPGSR